MGKEKNEQSNDYTVTVPNNCAIDNLNNLDVDIYDTSGTSIEVNAGDMIGSWTAPTTGTYIINSQNTYRGSWVTYSPTPLNEHKGYKTGEYVIFKGEPFKISSIQWRRDHLFDKQFELSSIEDAQGKGYTVIVTDEKLLSRSESLDILYNGK